MYNVTKRFTSGLLCGIEIMERTNIAFNVGATYKPACGSSSYIVVSCEKMA